MRWLIAFFVLSLMSFVPGIPWRRAESQESHPGNERDHGHSHGAGNDEHEASEASPSSNVSSTASAHDHDEEEEENGHDHGEEEGEDGHDHGEPEIVTLTPQAVLQAGIQVTPAQKGRISHEITLTGTITSNEERTVHLGPKVTGVVREVLKGLGDRVESGEPVVILDSTELGTSKVDFMRLFQEREAARIELERKSAVKTNTERLIALLRTDLAPLEVEAKTRDLALGENRAKLLTTYSTVRLAQSSYTRQERLFKRKVTSEKEFLDAKREIETAQAAYRGALDEVSFAIQSEFLAAEREFRTRDVALQATDQQLQVLGVSPEEITELREGRAKDLNVFQVRSPISGTLIEKHGSLGERVSPETTLATIADLNRLWVIGDVYEKDLAHVHPGMPSVVSVPPYPERAFHGVVSIVSRVVDPNTRTSRVRIVVENPENILSIGMFATVKTTTGAEESVLSVPLAAIQEIEGHSTLFVREAETRFRAQPVMIGARDEKQKRVEVYSGIHEGEPVVVAGAFFLRSELAKGEMGHDHAH